MLFKKIIRQFAILNKSKIQSYFYRKSASKVLPKNLQNFKKHELNALFFLSIETPIELCRFFKISIFQLEELINQPVYTTYTIKKKKGGLRQISAPEQRIKKIQKQLNYFLQAYYLMIKPAEVHGFVVNPHYRGTYCNILENAKPHIGKKQVLNVDLKDFFPSISSLQVKELFTSEIFNFNEEIAIALTLLTTYESALPIGSPASPVISNFICLQLDHELRNFAKENDLVYTRYADDLTFSSDTFISSDNILDIINLIKKNNFQFNDKKLRLKSSNRKQVVTGLTVNKKVNVDRALLKKIRAMLHDLSVNGIEKATQTHFKLKNADVHHKDKFINKLQSYINFVGQVRGKYDIIYIKFKTTFDALFVKVEV
jgi:RNA-directed DNA polymerase